MRPKNLAHILLAAEGFLLLSAIVFSTSFQLSRSRSVAETPTQAAEVTPVFTCEMTASPAQAGVGDYVDFTLTCRGVNPGSGPHCPRMGMFFRNDSGVAVEANISSVAGVTCPSPLGTLDIGEQVHCTVGDFPSEQVKTVSFRVRMPEGAEKLKFTGRVDRTTQCEGQMCPGPECYAEWVFKEVPVSLAGDPPTCQANLVLNRASAGPGDQITATVNVVSGSQPFKSGGVQLHAKSDSSNKQRNLGAISACDGRTSCSTSYTLPAHATMDPGNNILWLTMESAGDLNCTDKPGTPQDRLCRCGTAGILVTVPTDTTPPTGSLIRLADEGAKIKVKAEWHDDIGLQSVVVLIGKKDEAGHYQGIAESPLYSGSPSAYAVTYSIDLSWDTTGKEAGDYDFCLSATDKAGNKCLCNPGGDYADCGPNDWIKFTVPLSSGGPGAGPSCSALTIAPASGAADARFTATVNCTSGDSPFDKLYLMARQFQQHPNQARRLTTYPQAGLCSGQPTCSTSFSFYPQDYDLPAGEYRIWLASAAGEGKCTDVFGGVAGVPACGPGEKTFTVQESGTADLSFQIKGGGVAFGQTGFACTVKTEGSRKDLSFKIKAEITGSHPLASEGIGRLALRYRRVGESDWNLINYHKCPEHYDVNLKRMVGSLECTLGGQEWWDWIPRTIYRGTNNYEFKATAYAVGSGAFADKVITGVPCEGPSGAIQPPAVAQAPVCELLQLDPGSNLTVGQPVRLKVRGKCVTTEGGEELCSGNALTTLGIKDILFYQRVKLSNGIWGPWQLVGSRSCRATWPLHAVCSTEADRSACARGDSVCQAGAFNWTPTLAGQTQVKAVVVNNSNRTAECLAQPRTVGASAADLGETLASSDRPAARGWWAIMDLVSTWIKRIPQALAADMAPLKFSFHLTDSQGSVLGHAVVVRLLDGGQVYNMVAVPQGEGRYSAQINLPAELAGTVRVGIKPVGYLQRVGEVELAVGQTAELDMTDREFLGGDLNDDNKLTIADLVEGILPVFVEANELSIPVDADNRLMDLNEDGVLNILDISLVLKNLTALEVPGE